MASRYFPESVAFVVNPIVGAFAVAVLHQFGRSDHRHVQLKRLLDFLTIRPGVIYVLG